jgi:hypothetical protein
MPNAAAPRRWMKCLCAARHLIIVSALLV